MSPRSRRVSAPAIFACAALAAAPVSGATVFFSTVGTIGGGVTPGPAELLLEPGEPGQLYIWCTDDQDYDTSVGVDVTSSAPGVIAFTDGSSANPDIVSDALGGTFVDRRWTAAAVGSVSPDFIDGIAALELVGSDPPPGGISASYDGTVPPDLWRDTLYDVPAGAFLLGSVSFDALAPGTTQLTMESGDTLYFLHGETQIFPIFEPATVTVAEPGDMNCDGAVDIATDLPLFVSVLLDPAGYAPPPACALEQADMNEDGNVDGRHVTGFVGAMLAP